MDVDQIIQSLKQVMINTTFVKMCMTLTVLYFVITGIQFWMSDYYITQLKVNKKKVFLIFGIVSITGPVLGVIVGGKIVSMLGGYNTRKSFILIFFIALFSSACSIPIGYLHGKDDYLLVTILLWFLLFGGGFLLPCATGIMLNTVSEELRTTANSIANIWYNLLGFLPAPYLYGLIADSGEGNNKKLSMRLLMFMPFISFLILFWVAIVLFNNGYGLEKTNDKNN